MNPSNEIAITTSDVFGKKVVCTKATLERHRLKHQEPFSDDDIVECVSNPDIVAKTGHVIPEHKDRLLFYKESQFDDAPKMMKTVIDYEKEPGLVTSMFRTSRFTQDGAIVYTREGYLEEKLR
ncbi:MAG: hypothetical protein IJI88_02350 [Atopobiaceae bacterium]|nr:hypothetical protein [Atopobiaceae bacterium]